MNLFVFLFGIFCQILIESLIEQISFFRDQILNDSKMNPILNHKVSIWYTKKPGKKASKNLLVFDG